MTRRIRRSPHEVGATLDLCPAYNRRSRRLFMRSRNILPMTVFAAVFIAGAAAADDKFGAGVTLSDTTPIVAPSRAARGVRGQDGSSGRCGDRGLHGDGLLDGAGAVRGADGVGHRAHSGRSRGEDRVSAERERKARGRAGCRRTDRRRGRTGSRRRARPAARREGRRAGAVAHRGDWGGRLLVAIKN